MQFISQRDLLGAVGRSKWEMRKFDCFDNSKEGLLSKIQRGEGTIEILTFKGKGLRNSVRPQGYDPRLQPDVCFGLNLEQIESASQPFIGDRSDDVRIAGDELGNEIEVRTVAIHNVDRQRWHAGGTK